MDIQVAKQNISLVQVANEAGVQLRKSVGKCPFHKDRNPSFTIYQDRRYYCFGCHAKGDVIDFVRNYYNLDFPGALKFLGIKTGPLTADEKRVIERRKYRQKLLSEYRSWEQEVIDRLSLMIRCTNLVKPLIKCMADAMILDRLPWWEHLLEILLSGDGKEKLKVYNEAENGRFWI